MRGGRGKCMLHDLRYRSTLTRSTGLTQQGFRSSPKRPFSVRKSLSRLGKSQFANIARIPWCCPARTHWLCLLWNFMFFIPQHHKPLRNPPWFDRFESWLLWRTEVNLRNSVFRQKAFGTELISWKERHEISYRFHRYLYCCHRLGMFGNKQLSKSTPLKNATLGSLEHLTFFITSVLTDLCCSALPPRSRSIRKQERPWRRGGSGPARAPSEKPKTAANNWSHKTLC